MNILSYIKFAYLFLYRLVVRNPYVMLLIFGIITSYIFAGTLKDSVITKKVENSFKLGDKYLYVYSEIKSNEMIYDIYKSDKPMKVVNNTITYSKYNDLNVVLWIIFGILSLVFVLGTTINSDDFWDLDNCWDYAFSSLIKCDMEDGLFYYHALGKLIETKTTKYRGHHLINRQLDIDSFVNLHSCPKWVSKRNHRDLVIDELLKNKK